MKYRDSSTVRFDSANDVYWAERDGVEVIDISEEMDSIHPIGSSNHSSHEG